MSYPFSWHNWARFYRARLPLDGPRALLEAAGRAALALTNKATWALSRDAPLPRRAVVIVGHQRSGTTWLHRMLAAHPAAAALPLHALALPADAVQRPLARARRPAWLERLQHRLLAHLDPLHRLRLHEPEEDEFLLWGLFRSPMNNHDRPWPDGAFPGIGGDEAAMAFYAQAVARAVRRTGRRYVGKNPHFSHRVPALRAALPGVRVIQLVRHPAEAIPSRLSLIRAIWRLTKPGFTDFDDGQIEAMVQGSLRCYRACQGQADLDVAYTELVAEPAAVVRRVHDHFGLEPVDPEFERSLTSSKRAGRTPHRYTLEEFGLTRERLARELAPVYERWGFEA